MLQRKCSIVITFLLLETESEARKPLSQSFLADFANDVGCPCDRKTIGRHLALLQNLIREVWYTAKPLKIRLRVWGITSRCVTMQKSTCSWTPLHAAAVSVFGLPAMWTICRLTGSG